MATRDPGSYFISQKNEKKSQTSLSELVKATENVTAADALTVNAELKSFNKKKERALHTILKYLFTLGRAWENTHTATEQKLKLIASNQSTHNSLFYVHLSTIGNASSITRKKICYH